jgi:hypothetical protein
MSAEETSIHRALKPFGHNRRWPDFAGSASRRGSDGVHPPSVSPAGALSLKARRAMVLLLLLIGLAAVIGILIPIRAGMTAHGLERLDPVGDGSDHE